MKRIFFAIFLSCPIFLFGQLNPVENSYQGVFDEAYQQNPEIPKGVLEAIAYTQTRITHLKSTNTGSCTGMPQYLGVMGLIEDGKGYFNETLRQVSILTGTSVENLKNDPELEIIAFADAYNLILFHNGGYFASVEDKISLLRLLTEIPLHRNLEGNYYAFDCYLYSIIQFMMDKDMQEFYGFPNPKINGEKLLGKETWEFMSSPRVNISGSKIVNEESRNYQHRNDYNQTKSPDYPPGIWNPAASCNYSSRAGTPISAVTIHTVQGSYSGCISWFQNCSASVSAHYVVRSSDGQVTQMVYESDKGWHVGSENPYTVGIEHEGFVSNPAWYTDAMYLSSSALVSDICVDNNIDRLRTGWFPWLASTHYNTAGTPGSCIKVKGHQHYPNQTHTDPGINWNWDRFFKLIHPTPTANILTAPSGNFYDSGGSTNDYVNDERIIWTIEPPGATSVSVTFTSFNLEEDWDYLYIYDGADIDAPLIGYYTGTVSPGIVVSSGSSITFEFRSDCATIAPGWEAAYVSNTGPGGTDSIPPVSSINVSPGWETQDFDVSFTDDDEAGGSGLHQSFYHVSYFDGNGLFANPQRGFFRDEFDLATFHPQWTALTGNWTLSGTFLEQDDETNSNTNIYSSLNQELSEEYLYEFNVAIGGSGGSRRAGFHFFCDSAQLTNRGNSYFVWFRLSSQQLEFYKVVNDVFSLEHTQGISVNPDQWYNIKVRHNNTSGNIKVYMDNVLAGEWTDPIPLTVGKYISFRSGDANFKIENIKVYRSRPSNAATTVTVGNCIGCDLMYQNFSPPQPAGQLLTLTTDSAANISAITGENVNVDWTAPSTLYYVNDFSIFDEDTLAYSALIGGNWNIAEDTNSSIGKYLYAIGTTPGDSDVVGWTDNWFYTNFSDSISLISNQWYYISAKAVNGASIPGSLFSSDGFIFINLDQEEELDALIVVYPNPTKYVLNITGLPDGSDELNLNFMDVNGKQLRQQTLQYTGGLLSVSVPMELANGTYILTIAGSKFNKSFRLVVSR